MKTLLFILVIAQSALGQIQVATSNLVAAAATRTNPPGPIEIHGDMRAYAKSNHWIQWPMAAQFTFQDGFYGDNYAGVYPPDAALDVGPTNILVAQNDSIISYNRNPIPTGGNPHFYAGTINMSLPSFWEPHLIASTNLTSDPQIHYDRLSQRWFVSSISLVYSGIPPALQNNNYLLLAVSDRWQIANATTWTYYKFLTPFPDTFCDFDQMGVTADGVYISCEIYPDADVTLAINKADLLNGTTNYSWVVNAATVHGCHTIPQPASDDDPLATGCIVVSLPQTGCAPNSPCGYSSGQTGNSLGIARITNPGSNAVIIGTGVPVTYFAGPMCPQPARGSSPGLDAIGNRLSVAIRHRVGMPYHESNGYQTQEGSLWVAHTIEANQAGSSQIGGGRNGVRWYEIGIVDNPLFAFLVQSGTVYDPNTQTQTYGVYGYWCGSIASSGQGHATIFCNQSADSFIAQPGQFPATVAVRHLRTDPLGVTVGQPSASVVYNSASAYTLQNGSGSFQRWGDYSRTVVDPNDDMTIWGFTETSDTDPKFGLPAWVNIVTKSLAPRPPRAISCTPTSFRVNTTNSITINCDPTQTGLELFESNNNLERTNHISGTASNGVTIALTKDPILPIWFQPGITNWHVATITVSATAQTNAVRKIILTNPDGQSSTSAVPLITITP